MTIKATPGPPKKGKRQIKAEETRRALFAAAAVVVGKVGYERASVSEITRLAGVASGTFYNHFANRQSLFNELLPTAGEELLEYIRSRLIPQAEGAELERQRVVAYFEFLEQNPGYLRILNEAEVFAPLTFKGHIKNFATRYIRALSHQHARGQIGDFKAEEMEAVAYILMGARAYMTMLWKAKSGQQRKELGSQLLDTYVKLVTDGLFGSQSGRKLLKD